MMIARYQKLLYFFSILFLTVFVSCETCEDPDACNNGESGECDYSCICSDVDACNNGEKAECDYSCYCDDPTACNYNEKGTCDFSCYCQEADACNFGEVGECDFSCYCTDANACNFGELGDCDFSCYCSDPTACNYNTMGECNYSCFTESGVYLGIIGFNDELNVKNMKLLNAYSSSEMQQFVDFLSMDDGTVLYHAVNTALDQLEAAQFPDDIELVSIITFTDGLDLGSYILNEEYNSGAEYLSAVNSRILNEKMHGLPITAYTIGLRGTDVTDEVQFQENLQNLASTGNAEEFQNIQDVQLKFAQIADSLTNVSSTRSLSLTLPAPDPNTSVRFTLDNVTHAETSEVYIEGIFTSSNGQFSLTEVTYHGLTSTSGATVTGVASGINITFTFEEIIMEGGEMFQAQNIKQWSYVPSTDNWQINSEFNPTEDTQTTVERNTAAIILVLDCSSSLGSSDFFGMKSAAKTFIQILSSN